MRYMYIAAAMLIAGSATAQMLTPRGDGTYEKVIVPGTRSGERLRVDPIPGTDRSAIRDSEGRRVGEARSNSYSDRVTIYDREGRRVSR